jgi:hypothetical protein
MGEARRRRQASERTPRPKAEDTFPFVRRDAVTLEQDAGRVVTRIVAILAHQHPEASLERIASALRAPLSSPAELLRIAGENGLKLKVAPEVLELPPLARPFHPPPARRHCPGFRPKSPHSPPRNSLKRSR